MLIYQTHKSKPKSKPIIMQRLSNRVIKCNNCNAKLNNFTYCYNCKNGDAIFLVKKEKKELYIYTLFSSLFNLINVL